MGYGLQGRIEALGVAHEEVGMVGDGPGFLDGTGEGLLHEARNASLE